MRATILRIHAPEPSGGECPYPPHEGGRGIVASPPLHLERSHGLGNEPCASVFPSVTTLHAGEHPADGILTTF